MKYRVWDDQLKQYAFSETIFKNKKEAIDQLVSYFSVDCEGDLTKIRAELWANNEFAELYLEVVEEQELKEWRKRSDNFIGSDKDRDKLFEELEGENKQK